MKQKATADLGKTHFYGSRFKYLKLAIVVKYCIASFFYKGIKLLDYNTTTEAIYKSIKFICKEINV